jgi:hypothetical protein
MVMMKIAIAAGAGAAIACASMTLLSAGVAAADPNVVGKRYSDAKGLLGDAGLTPVVATVVGDQVTRGDCFVVSTSKPTFLNQGGSAKGDTILVNLSCYPKQATARNPGFSAGNNAPAAKAVRDTEEAESMAWKQTAEGQKWCAEAVIEHPDWGAIPGC